MPEGYLQNRKSWREQLLFVKETLSNDEVAAASELQRVRQWAEGLSTSKESFGLIHYDFELDNLYWDHGEVGILDFDDCLNTWYVADICYALRDLFEESIDLNHPLFQEFIKGYSRETEIDILLIHDLPWFMRMHKLVLFATLLRTVDIEESEQNSAWLIGLRKKLVSYIEEYRASFEKLARDLNLEKKQD
jgi:Ser/Thr protein kinase RdoA (MazF antagonist)